MTARAQALDLALRHREMQDTESGDVQLLRARRYLAFLRGES
jgi:hypothetical protein